MDELPVYPLYVALTRPAINRWGVPYKGAVILLAATMIAWTAIGKGNPAYLATGIFGYVVLRALTEWEPHFMTILDVWGKTKANGYVEGGTMLRPISSGIPDDPEDIASAL